MSKTKKNEPVLRAPYWKLTKDLQHDPDQPRRVLNLLPILRTLTDDLIPQEYGCIDRMSAYDITEERPGSLELRDGAAITDAIKLRSGTNVIVDGEQRYVCALLCGIEVLKVVDVDVPDEKRLLYQMRGGNTATPLHPLDMADAIVRLRATNPAVTDAVIARECGIGSVRDVLRLEALSGLCPEAREAYRKGELRHRQASYIATLSTVADQKRAVEACADATDTATRFYVEGRHRRLVLAECHFDPGDASLSERGKCSTCPYNTAAQRKLWSDVAGSDERCTDAVCYERKQDVVWRRMAVAAAEKGVNVLEGHDAKKIFTKGKLSPEWVDLDAEYTKGSGTWWDVTRIEPEALARHPVTRRPHNLVTRERADQALRDAGIILDEAPPVPKKPGEPSDLVRSKAFDMAVAKVVQTIERSTFESGVKTLISMRLASLHELGDDSIEQLCRRREIGYKPDKSAEAVRKYVAGNHMEWELLGILFELEIGDADRNTLEEPSADSPVGVAFRFAGVEWPAMLERAKTELVAERSTEREEPRKCEICGCAESDGGDDERCELHSSYVLLWREGDRTCCQPCAHDMTDLEARVGKAGGEGLPLAKLLKPMKASEKLHTKKLLERLKKDRRIEERKVGETPTLFVIKEEGDE